MWRFIGETKLKIDMKGIYTEHTENRALVKARPHRVAYLLNYSSSLRISGITGIKFEINLN